MPLPRLCRSRRGIIAVAALRILCRNRQNILAQSNAFNLAQMLMAPVTLFQNDGQFGVMPSNEYDGEEETVIHIYYTFELGSAQ